MLKDYKLFTEEKTLNENMFKNAWDKVRAYFRKRYKNISWVYYMLYLKKTNQLKKRGIDIYVPYSLKGIPDAELVDDTIDETIVEKSRFRIIEPLNETTKTSVEKNNFVELTSDDPNKPDISPEELRMSIMDIVAENEDRIEIGEERADYTSTLFIWGASGIGKSSIIKKTAKELGMVTQVILLSTKAPEDLKGVPAARNVKGTDKYTDERTVFTQPKFLPDDNCPNGKGGILFLDEMNQADKYVLGAAMTLCLDGEIEDYKLPQHWVIVAAGNRPGDVGKGGNLTPFNKPLANRFTHYNYSLTRDQWIAHVMHRKNMNPDLIAYIEFSHDSFFKLDSRSKSDLFPTPRGWTKASNSEYVKRGKNWDNPISDDDLRRIYGGKVGLVEANKFIEFLKLKNKYNGKDVENVYKKGKNAKKLPTDGHLSRAVVVAISLHKKKGDLTVKDVKNVYEFALAESNFENVTSMMNYFAWVHPEVRTDSKFNPIYMNAVKEWYIRKQDVSGAYKQVLDEEEKQV